MHRGSESERKRMKMSDTEKVVDTLESQKCPCCGMLKSMTILKDSATGEYRIVQEPVLEKGMIVEAYDTSLRQRAYEVVAIHRDGTLDLHDMVKRCVLHDVRPSSIIKVSMKRVQTNGVSP